MGKPVLYDFSASWCGPCRLQKPELERLKQRLGDAVDIRVVDVDENPELAARYGIRVVPTLIIEKDNEIMQVFQGVTRADILEDELRRLL
ncbi:MAG TPA: thioredoxin fold domain-containing protein [Methermicoccus shengliensis]|uniref:Thioredoxin fold domain-containing protein n=2 Tax=Methermicoccus shengliensis TaxID=660064 RepID=A0A832RVN6_9EURY|nr:MAG: Thioredoxin domain protein [Euryarchaeota archaeon 55_53]KUK29499.1 MAG: Thioredoxin domain protein [Methanosarcinales archeaon 56_1174]MDI3487700.1 thioredoxin 1 [Methanosarcinales archaeon]MDN5295536.1 thioredoxin 1 [Methanosarcinales archaeon]HIH70297.1 thioredoxin fold domain-containing protein [Methermicoccus shengliensis]